MKYVVQPPLPSSILAMYVGMILFAIFIYVTVEEERMREFLQPIRGLFLDEKKKTWQTLVLIGFPLAIGVYSFNAFSPKISPPAELRTVHPAPPDEYVGLVNPLRESGEGGAKPHEGDLEEHVQKGAEIYFKNCFFCHGDALDGKGHFAEGFTPLPANFRDQGTIAQLQESYVFWRIKTGGPGLPTESQPWNSAMPIWEDFLTDEEIWQVILYIYEGAGVEPRTWE
ncbi:cytochrome c [candidate division TA06 bacterium]|nr:cytochrome c [candidate division TA06 bacterium]